MSIREHLAPGCDNRLLPEIILKQEIECNDEESTYSRDMYTSDPWELPMSLNYNDSKDHVLKQVKKELPEDEFLQIDHSINSENKEFLNKINKQEVKDEKIDEGLLLNIKEEDNDIQYQFTLETEPLEKHELLDEHSELEITRQELNSGLLIKFEDSTKSPSGNSLKCKNYKADIKEEYKSNIHINSSPPVEEIEKIVYKCSSCELVYKSKQALLLHEKRIHYDYGRMFGCWCGKEFRSPEHLATHRRVKHELKTPNKKTVYKCEQCNSSFKFSHSLTRHIKTIHSTEIIEFQCDYCKKIYKAKQSLVNHITTSHYDYNKVIECWCGKQYQTSWQLDVHKKRKHVYVHDGFKFIFS